MIQQVLELGRLQSLAIVLDRLQLSSNTAVGQSVNGQVHITGALSKRPPQTLNECRLSGRRARRWLVTRLIQFNFHEPRR